MTNTAPRYDTSATRFAGLGRHFADLRDMSHADAARSREEKERVFRSSTDLLAPVVHDVLSALNSALLLDEGEVGDSSTVRTNDGGLARTWSVTWEGQRARGIPPIHVIAFYGAGFHHPHLRGGTVGEWSFNVFNQAQAEAERGTVEAIAAAELHNLVFAADFRIVPATAAHSPAHGHGFTR